MSTASLTDIPNDQLRPSYVVPVAVGGPIHAIATYTQNHTGNMRQAPLGRFLHYTGF